MGDPLAALSAVMNWTIFMPVLGRIPRAEPKVPGGRPACAPLLMFKILAFQSFYGLSEADAVPDQNTIREFRENLTQAEPFSELFAAFNARLTQQGFITCKGQIIDASFVEVPRQRNRRSENAAIKDEEVPAGWEQDERRLVHKDLDARWTKVNEQSCYGCKDRVVADLASKLIVRAEVTPVGAHESQVLDSLTQPGDPETWADTASAGANCEAIFESKGIIAHVCEKGTRGQALTQGQQRSNRAKSRQRVRVEHIF